MSIATNITGKVHSTLNHSSLNRNSFSTMAASEFPGLVSFTTIPV